MNARNTSVARRHRDPADGRAALILSAALVLAVAGCAGLRGPDAGQVKAMRVSEMLDDPDPARRASTRLVLEGLDADEQFERVRARGSYERAVQVDPTNPFAYLALARLEIDDMQARRALSLLDQSAALFETQGLRNDRVGVLLLGLKGQARLQLGDEAGRVWLDRARELDPEVWADDDLSPSELR